MKQLPDFSHHRPLFTVSLYHVNYTYRYNSHVAELEKAFADETRALLIENSKKVGACFGAISSSR